VFKLFFLPNKRSVNPLNRENSLMFALKDDGKLIIANVKECGGGGGGGAPTDWISMPIK